MLRFKKCPERRVQSFGPREFFQVEELNVLLVVRLKVKNGVAKSAQTVPMLVYHSVDLQIMNF